MPIIYLSPSTQENNFYVSGGSEEYWMNRLADAMVPYLNASGIQYVRNTPEMTAASSILASNSGNFDLHLALHSNGAPEGQYGQIRGVLVFYYPGSAEGRRAAEIVAENLKKIFHSLLTKKDIYYRIYVYGYFMPSEKCMKFTDKEMII